MVGDVHLRFDARDVELLDARGYDAILFVGDIAGYSHRSGLEAARVVARDGHRVHLAFDPEHVSTATLIARVAERHRVRDLFVENPPIEEVIARLYAENGSTP